MKTIAEINELYDEKERTCRRYADYEWAARFSPVALEGFCLALWNDIGKPVYESEPFHIYYEELKAAGIICHPSDAGWLRRCRRKLEKKGNNRTITYTAPNCETVLRAYSALNPECPDSENTLQRYRQWLRKTGKASEILDSLTKKNKCERVISQSVIDNNRKVRCHQFIMCLAYELELQYEASRRNLGIRTDIGIYPIDRPRDYWYHFTVERKTPIRQDEIWL